MVGFAMGGAEREGDPRFQGELYAIYLLQEAQRRGHGRALAEAVADALVHRGLTSMLVWVLRDNLAARAFYERMGGVFLREHDLDFGAGFSVREVSYGWDDVRGGLAQGTDDLLRAGADAVREFRDGRTHVRIVVGLDPNSNTGR